MIEKDHAAPPYAQGLNPEQQAAGAGSGKTRVLTVRICHLIQHHGVPPERILAVTFTNKAAQEMRTRIRRALGTEPAGMWMGTFHSMGARLLRRHAPQLGWSHTFTILDAEQSLRQIKRTTEAVGLDPKRWSPKAIRAQISGAKNQLVGPQDFAADNGDSFDVFVRNVAKVYPRYQRSLKDQTSRTSASSSGTASDSPSSWWTSIRTPTGPSSALWSYWPGSTGTSWSWATTIRASTAGGAPTSATSSTSSKRFPGPPPCGSSRTTGPRSGSWPQPTP
jgi:hypothetical protein